MSGASITIERLPGGGFDVHIGHRSTGMLNFGEMLEQVVCFMHPNDGRARYQVFTWEEHQEGVGFNGVLRRSERQHAAAQSFRGEAWA